MGLTIHYSLKSSTRSPNKARKLVEQLRQRAMDLPFTSVNDIVEFTGEECKFERRDLDDRSRWLLIQAGGDVQVVGSGGVTHWYSVDPTHVIAFETVVGDGCEPANFGLCRYPAEIEIDDPKWPSQKKKLRTGMGGWRWGSFCKTQYASNPECGGVENSLRCHLSVVRMLDFAKSLGILESVSDEGEYWERRDLESLAREVGDWNQMIAGAMGKFKDLLGDQNALQVESPITQFPNFEHLEAAGRGKR